MAQKTAFVCDRCGVEKGPANHWFRVCRHKIMFKHGAIGLLVVPWETEVKPDSENSERHLCGEGCLIAEVQEFAGGNVA